MLVKMQCLIFVVPPTTCIGYINKMIQLVTKRLAENDAAKIHFLNRTMKNRIMHRQWLVESNQCAIALVLQMAHLFQRSASVKLKRRTKHTMGIRKKALIKKGLFRYTIFYIFNFYVKISKNTKKILHRKNGRVVESEFSHLSRF